MPLSSPRKFWNLPYKRQCSLLSTSSPHVTYGIEKEVLNKPRIDQYLHIQSDNRVI
jgi:hypothetical protein